MTTTPPTPPDAELRQALTTALLDAAHVCGEDCPAESEAACHAAHPVQEAVSHGGVVTDVYGPISALVEVLLPVVAARDAQTRAQALREAAGYARSRSADNWGAASGSPSTVLCTVSDELYARADGIHRGQA